MSSERTYAQQAPGATGVDRNHPAEAGYLVEVVDGPAGVAKVPDPPRKKIAICGFAASSRDLAPFGDPEWEIWGLNQLYRHIPRATRWFDIHVNWAEDNVPDTDHPGWLKQCGIPVYMSSHEPSIPTSVCYPLAAVTAGVTGVDYFTSTVAYMVALAVYEIDRHVEGQLRALPAENTARILEHPEDLRRALAELYAPYEIGIFGIDLVVGTEYDWQKSCVEYLLGLANARGITVRLPAQCALLKQRWRYGYQVEPDSYPIRPAELAKRNAALSGERAQLIAKLQTIDGALQENGYWAQVADLRMKGATVKLNEDT